MFLILGGGASGTQKRSEEKGGTVKIEDEEEKKEGSPSIKLGLGIDGNMSEKPVIEHGKCAFTTTQLHELQLQALIFKYIAGGIPVPLNLVMPIWKTVASSFGSAHGGIYEQYPSFVGISPQGFDYRNMMDPEPGRCRRTDGKKWRCGKNVIPDQKYCEQHMHRGCRRSRKPVEPSQITLPDTTLLKSSNKESENSKNHSTPVSVLHMKPTYCKTSTSHETAAMDSNNVCSNRNSISINATTSSTIIVATNNGIKNNSKRNKSSPNTSERGEDKLSVSNNNMIIRSSKAGNKAAVGNSISLGVGFSPKSVLQVLGCSSSCVHKNEIGLEPGRCRRTDGKRWRCSRDVIPDQKYCARHMHRGARKQVEVSQPVAIPSIGDCPPSRSTIANKAACGVLSTSLSMSIPSPGLITQDEKSMSSSSETTISDTTITAFENGNFS
ncbi:growth-regulating factor 9-like [Durio zibethinus]|uniref:Growth-regulating factor n=1 Tax=Durio zibethinus TaxID=66656 RepID=A0A6P6A3F2_DURZI|nr:growth-regulating factor 9-like [Durio zibethinus]